MWRHFQPTRKSRCHPVVCQMHLKKAFVCRQQSNHPYPQVGSSGQGGNAPEFDFATLYRVSRMEKGKIYLPWKGGRLLGKAKLGERGILEVLK